ncbi:MATE family efflux transporter [Carnimonas bestiolae]|uniref:MATE family efflux transporter n=1 Tax=Carnimonas bestiolae TaxID=3402172 RepID=UPI003EDC2CBD
MSALPEFNRKSASASLIRMSMPILVGQLAQMGISTGNVILAGHSSTVDLAAVSLGASLWVPLLVLMNGILMGLTPVIAQLFGARRFADMADPVQQNCWIALCCGIIAAVLIYLVAPSLLALMSVPDDVQQAATRYLEVMAFGMPGLAFYFALRSWSDGLNHTKPGLWISLLGLAASIAVGVLLVPGIAGLPRLGAVGCGLASAVSMWVSALCMWRYVAKAKVYRPVEVWKNGLQPPRLSSIMALLKVGLPIGVAVFSEVTMFSVIALLISVYGTITIAAHELALNITGVLFMVPMSLGIALTIRVGTRLGEQLPRTARKEAWNGMLLAVLGALINALIIWLFARQILAIYTSNADVMALALNLLHLTMIFQLSDSLQAGLAGALRGYKDTRAVMLITLTAYWPIGIGSGVVLGYGVGDAFEGFGIYGFWTGFIISLTSAAVLLAMRLHRVARRHAPPSWLLKETPAPHSYPQTKL